MSEPTIEARDPQPYVAICAQVPIAGLAGAIDQAIPRLFGWLGERGIPPAGPPFIRYLKVDMARELLVDVAVPVGGAPEPDGDVRGDTLPGGRYAVLLHVGPYDGLIAANAALQDWAREQGLVWATDGAVWTGRVERHLTNPLESPDPSTWETEVAYLIG